MSKVLIFDMDLEDRDMMMDIMTEQGWERVSCITHQEAIIFYDKFKPDLVLCNNLMPTIYDGRRFINEIRNRSKSVYIIVLSPLKDKNAINDMIDLGVNDYIVKPIDKSLLLWKIKIKFPAINYKEFARVNLSDNTDISNCYFDVKVAIAGMSEDYMDIYSPYSLSSDTKIRVSSKLFAQIGLSFDSTTIKVVEVQKLPEKIKDCSYVSRGLFTELSPKDEIQIRKWVLANRIGL